MYGVPGSPSAHRWHDDAAPPIFAHALDALVEPFPHPLVGLSEDPIVRPRILNR
jgi:hypothetical protein